MVICKECRFFRSSWPVTPVARFAKCVAIGEHDGVSPVTGKIIQRFQFCDIRRELRDECGPEGKLFEQKKKKWWRRKG